MSDSNEKDAPGAKLDATPPVSGRFNQENNLAEKIKLASPEAQEKCKMLQELADTRREQERKNQQRAHKFRVSQAKVELFEKYIRDPAPRPNDAQSKDNDLKEMHYQSERMVTEREEYFMENIGRESDKNMYQVLRDDQHSRSGQQSQHDHEQER